MSPHPTRLPRFAFLVHALSGLHRRAVGVRTLRLGVATGRRDGTAPDDVAVLCEVGLEGIAEGVVVGIPMDPEQLLDDQERALLRMERAVAVAAPLDAVGLGSLCAVVAGRGEALAEKVAVPVTTGAAATAWAMVENTRSVRDLRRHTGPVALIGSAGPVGGAVGHLLAEAGVPLVVDSKRAASRLARVVSGAAVQVATAAEAAARCTVVVGAGPTGGTVPASALQPGTVIVDVALPATVAGRLPAGCLVLAGEALSLPPTWQRGGWGHAYHLFAGYGPRQVFACLVEPLVLAVEGRTAPYALGRRVSPDDVRAFGLGATRLGFAPRLSHGWRGLSPLRRLRLRG